MLLLEFTFSPSLSHLLNSKKNLLTKLLPPDWVLCSQSSVVPRNLARIKIWAYHVPSAPLKTLVASWPVLNSLAEHTGPSSTRPHLLLLSIMNSFLWLYQTCLPSTPWPLCSPFFAFAHTVPSAWNAHLLFAYLRNAQASFKIHLPLWISRCPPSDANLFCPQFAHNMLNVVLLRVLPGRGDWRNLNERTIYKGLGSFKGNNQGTMAYSGDSNSGSCYQPVPEEAGEESRWERWRGGL